mmetsp:Transcript_1025/g.1547  ORF Transcript_1025/g.1547 Transcript_1025/m.1547 type:complete len:112 (-) Transcript_1025:45-380(-)
MMAEKMASEKIAEARAARNEKMKNAKREAQILIDEYRKEKEKSYQESLEKTLGTSGSESENLQRQTDAEVSKMKQDFERNKSTVINMLVGAVCSVTCVVPEGRKRNMPQDD